MNNRDQTEQPSLEASEIGRLHWWTKYTQALDEIQRLRAENGQLRERNERLIRQMTETRKVFR